MSIPQNNIEKKYTYRDYLTWSEEERWEIIEGIPYMQSAPTWQHQAISVNIVNQFYNYLKGKPCRAFTAPFDVCIAEYDESDEAISNLIVQPDIVIVCNESKLRKTGYFGVPSLIVEISSPSTARKDKLLKFNAFEKAKVKEYWIVEPENKLINIFILQENNRYGRPNVYSDEDKINVNIFPELLIDLKDIFGDS